MPTAIDVAKYILSLTDEDSGELISHLKLQKLVYYAQGYCLAILGRPLFADRIVAWQHGPVTLSVWEAYKGHGANPIPKPDGFDRNVIDDEARGVVDEVYTVLGQYSAWKLRNMTHEEAPWANVEINEEITPAAMTDFFRGQIVA
ncbi:MAG: Antitoxin SocA [Luteibacter sp.]|uniref:Panacea domain-containing protein n=1 Tax=Luteibacter sp. TaxID=1886636 RepID=UPI00137FE4F2|nr:type II toxin-antitoxin system antitoxin SocA domain-containing protein [Luteibacter sp.]KAF1006754.1 MAG: Antitoxin SocA [Luteibacter sp.]